MSFRARLTVFFVLIVVIPMAAMGFLVFRLIDDSSQGKAEARANGIAGAAASVYQESSRAASLEARNVAARLAGLSGNSLRARVHTLVRQSGVARLTVAVGGRTVASAGSVSAVAPGIAVIRGHPRRTISVSVLTAAQLAAALDGNGFDLVIRQHGRTLGSSLGAANGHALPGSGQVSLGGVSYQAATVSLSGFGGPVSLTVLSPTSITGGSVSTDRLFAALFIIVFLLLAVGFALLASRALQGQLSGFLQAARRLAGGDFSEPVPTRGHDEFAALGEEFNNMSRQLAARLHEVEREQARVRSAIRNIGEAFAANLDRDALLELALRTAMEATNADRGRVSAREHAHEPLAEMAHFGELDGIEAAIHAAEHTALDGQGVGEASAEGLSIASVCLGTVAPGGPTYGLITVGRSGSSFSQDDLELLRSLANRATLALANVSHHNNVQRQAITDDLTGLTTHGHFQELLAAEMEEVRRYNYPVGLVMLDLDNFKLINDLHGHQQGDVVLRYVADALRETSRDVDVAARYGGEELALILPHTDLEGTYVIAERAREAIGDLEIPLVEGDGALRVTASAGVAASSYGHKDDLIGAADSALYAAKRTGKNRTVRAASVGQDGQTAANTDI
jgi:diguanylate cyclase (GGDEF)-like protein